METNTNTNLEIIGGGRETKKTSDRVTAPKVTAPKITTPKINKKEKAEAEARLNAQVTKKPICNTLEKIDVVVGDKAYVEIKNECKGTGYGFETYMPILHITNNATNDNATNDNALNNSDVSVSDASQDTLMNSFLQYSSENISSSSAKEGDVRVGLKADVTIVKVRKTAWLTLANALVFYAKELEPTPIPITETGIYKNKQNDKEITLVVQANQSNKRYTAISKTYNLCKFGEVFEGANVDEAEEHMSGGAGLVRKNMEDNNPAMKNIDEAMFEIISILFLLMNINYENWSQKANLIIQAFIATSSAKEYLDTGQLYAICGPTIKLNEKRGYKAKQILDRCKTYFSVVEQMDIPKGGMNNGKKMGYNYDSDSSVSSVSTINSLDRLNQLRPEFRNNSELLASLQQFEEEEESLKRSRALIGKTAVTPTQRNTPDNSLVATVTGDSPPPTLRNTPYNSLEDTLIDDQNSQSSEMRINRKLAYDYDKSDDAFEQTNFNNEANEDESNAVIANSFEDENNAVIANSNDIASGISSSSSDIQLPHKPMLETIDGAATRIAANQFFASYCASKLEGKKKSENACFVIDNNDVFLLTIWFSKDTNVIKFLEDELNKYHQPNLTKPKMAEINNKFIENDNTIDELIIQLKRPELNEKLKIQKQEELNKLTKQNAVKKIDICYYILQNYRDLLESTRTTLKQKSKTALVIEKNDYDIFSVACFLYKYNSSPNIVEDLIKCNFDPLCHDNGHSKIYRLIMVLIFILKNSTEDIKANLKLMFPYYFVSDTDTFDPAKIKQLDATTIVNEVYIFLPSMFLGLDKYINYIFQCLTNDQKCIFKILAGHNYDKIENQLFLRLLKKSCYVFQVLKQDDKDSDKVIVTCFNDSAHKAFQTANTKVNRFGGKQLSSFLFTPRYTYCAIDAPLKNGVSLSGYNLIPFYSKVYLTAVTMNDAASQITTYSGKYTEPICIKIDVNNIKIDVNNIKTDEKSFEFTYKYVYGKSVSIKSKDIEIPEQIKNFGGEYEDQYKEIIEDLNNIKFKFYSGKKNVDAFKVELKLAVDPLLFIVGKIDSKIRDALSRLYENCIVNVNKIPDQKAQFLSFFVDYISTPPSDSSSSSNDLAEDQKKQDLIDYTYKFLELVKETDLNALVTSIDDFRNNNEDKLKDYDSQNVTEEPSGKKRRGRGGGVDTPVPDLSSVATPSSATPSQAIRIKTTEPEPPLLEPEPEFPIEPGSGLNEQAKGVGINEMPVEMPVETQDEPDELQYSYSTLFGKYGFDMAINEDGEYELHILDTQEQYDAYLRKYGLQEEDETEEVEQQQVGQQQVEQQQVQAAEGGKRKKTKKHKRVKYNTRRVPKVRLNKSKRKGVRKATKTRSRK